MNVRMKTTEKYNTFFMKYLPLYVDTSGVKQPNAASHSFSEHFEQSIWQSFP